MSDDNLSDAIKKLTENVPTNQRGSFFASTATFDAVSREMDKAADKTNLFGMKMRASPFIEHGNMYFHKEEPRPIKPFQPIALENEIRINRWIHGNMGRYFSKPIFFHGKYEGKFNDESWHDYIQRCGIIVLDNPVMRWEYQKYIMSTPIRLIRRFIAWYHTS